MPPISLRQVQLGSLGEGPHRADDGHGPDAELALWAGELPLAVTWQQPVPDAARPPDIAHIRSRAGTQAEGQASAEHNTART